MIPVLTAEQAGAWDDRARHHAAIPSRVLMEAAGRAVAWAASREYPGALLHGVLLVAGHGNNGGDGWVAARALKAAGATVRAVEVKKNRTRDCEANRALALADGVELIDGTAAWADQWLAIDALLGTGASGKPRGPFDTLAERLARHPGPIVAVDGPTGLDLSSGEAHGPVRAGLTVTFGGARRGHLLARDWCGAIVIADIGFPPAEAEWPALVTDQEAAAWLPGFDVSMHKGQRGRVLVIGGDEGMAGALLHAAASALSAGAGLVKLAASETTVRAAQSRLPDALSVVTRLGPTVEADLADAMEWADAIVLGPGMGRGEPRQAFVRQILEACTKPVIVDADALHSGLDALLTGAAPRAFTPHPGEFAAMFPELADLVASDRFAACVQASRRSVIGGSQSAVLLKGVPTLIGAPDVPLRVVAAGNPALATGGSGDLLSGFLGAFLARGLSPRDAACLGAMVLGRGAELASADYTVRSTRPADVLATLPQLWRRWQRPMAVTPPVLARLERVALT